MESKLEDNSKVEATQDVHEESQEVIQVQEVRNQEVSKDHLVDMFLADRNRRKDELGCLKMKKGQLIERIIREKNITNENDINFLKSELYPMSLAKLQGYLFKSRTKPQEEEE